MTYANGRGDVIAWVDEQQRRNVQDHKLCKCSAKLPASIFYQTGMWAASTEDVERLRAHQATEHDVLSGSGRRLRIGSCKPV